MSNNKFWTAINNLKSSAECVVEGTITTEEDYNKIKWVTGVENNEAVLSDTCPHTELTWSKVKAEMDKL